MNPITAAEQALARANSRAFLATLLSVVLFLAWVATIIGYELSYRERAIRDRVDAVYQLPRGAASIGEGK